MAAGASEEPGGLTRGRIVVATLVVVFTVLTVWKVIDYRTTPPPPPSVSDSGRASESR